MCAELGCRHWESGNEASVVNPKRGEIFASLVSFSKPSSAHTVMSGNILHTWDGQDCIKTVPHQLGQNLLCYLWFRPGKERVASQYRELSDITLGAVSGHTCCTMERRGKTQIWKGRDKGGGERPGALWGPCSESADPTIPAIWSFNDAIYDLITYHSFNVC